MQSSFSEFNIDCWRIFWIWNASWNVKPDYFFLSLAWLPSTSWKDSSDRGDKKSFGKRSNPILTSQEIVCFVFFCWTCRNHSVNKKENSVVEENINVSNLTVRKCLIINCFVLSPFLFHQWNIMIGQSASDMISNLVYRPLQDSLEWKQRMRRRQRTSFFFITCLYEIVEFGKG